MIPASDAAGRRVTVEDIIARMDPGLIPVALARAQLVSPDEAVRSLWEEKIFEDLEYPTLSFCWGRFLNSLVP